MTHIPAPKQGFIEELVRKPWTGDARWMDATGARLYTWDQLHGEFEVFTRRGYHLGAVEPVVGKLIKGPVKGRKIDV